MHPDWEISASEGQTDNLPVQVNRQTGRTECKVPTTRRGKEQSKIKQNLQKKVEKRTKKW